MNFEINNEMCTERNPNNPSVRNPNIRHLTLATHQESINITQKSKRFSIMCSL